MTTISALKPKLEFPKEFTEAAVVKSTELAGKKAKIVSAMSYTKEGIAKAAFLLEIGGKTFALYTQARALVDICERIEELGDEFDGANVVFVMKKAKSGKDYLDVEDAE